MRSTVIAILISWLLAASLAGATATPESTATPGITATPGVTATPDLTATPASSPTPEATAGDETPGPSPTAETTPPPGLVPPELLAPADGARFGRASTAPDLIWQPVMVATGYDVQLGLDPAFESATDPLPADDAVYALSRLLPEADWQPLELELWWRVRSVLPPWAGGWSQARRMVKTPLGAPVLLWPEPDARHGRGFAPPRFEWTTLAEAAGYRIQFAEDEAFDRLLGQEDWPDPVLDLGTMLDQVEWNPVQLSLHWRVAGRTTGGRLGPWSAGRRYTKTATFPPQLTGPGRDAYGPAEGEPPLFTWSACCGESEFQIQLALNEAFDEVLLTLDSLDPRLDLGAYFPDREPWYDAYGSFWWRVSARTAAGLWGPWSTPDRYSKLGRYRILAAGNSITFGEGWEGGGYPAILETWLQGSWSPLAAVPNEGIPGAKTAHLTWYMEEFLERNLPEMAVLMAGTNDSLDPNGCTRWGEPYGCLVKENLRAAIQTCRQRGVAPILATVIPPNPEDHWAENPRIYYNNDEIRALAWEEGVLLVDMFDHFMAYPGNLASLYADSLHCNEDGYRYMAEGFFQAIGPLH